MDTFTIHADFNLIDGTPSKTKWVKIVTSAQVLGPDGELFDDADIAVVGGVLNVAVPATTNEPHEFTYTIVRERGKTKLWRVPAQAPGTTAELSDFTESLPLVIPLNQQGATQADLLAHLSALDPHGDRAYTDTGVADAMNAAAGLLAGHLAATDPHGDRAYTTAQISAAVNSLINSAPGTLNTLGEIAAALADDDSVVAALTTLVNTKASQAALDAEVTARTNADNALDGRVDTLEGAVPSYNDLTDKPSIPNSPDDIGAEALGVAANLVAAHLAAADPHGDRAYTNAQISAAINSLVDAAPGTLDTLGEIATALAEDDSAVAALTTLVNTKAAAVHTHGVDDLTATGTRNSSTVLHGDNTFGLPYPLVGQAEAEAGAGVSTRGWTPERVKQAINALGIPIAQKNAAQGVAGLDASSLLIEAQHRPRLQTTGKAIIANLNLATETGWYCSGNATSGNPVAGGFYNVMAIAYQYANYVTQIAFNAVGTDIWHRQQQNGTWGAWARVDNAGGTDVAVFTANGTWTKPAGITHAEVYAFGPGAGGGSGAVVASGTAASGGGGGGGGGFSQRTLLAAELGATEAVIVGQGGAGNAAKTADSTNGAAGATGSAATQFGNHLWAGQGNGGSGGTAGGGASGGGGGTGSSGGSAGGSGASGGAGGNASFPLHGSGAGGAGGGISTAGGRFNGGNGGRATDLNISGGAGGANGNNGGDGGAGWRSAGNQIPALNPGTGGGGGGGAINAAQKGGNGGPGGFPGGGGGGGGAALNGIAGSGAGGAGGNGLVVVISRV